LNTPVRISLLVTIPGIPLFLDPPEVPWPRRRMPVPTLLRIPPAWQDE